MSLFQSEMVKPLFHFFHNIAPLTALVKRNTGGQLSSYQHSFSYFTAYSRHQKGSNPFSTSSIKSLLSLHSWWGIQEDSSPLTSMVSLILLLILVIRKGPTPFPLLPLSRSSHCLWRQAGDSSPYAQICSPVTSSMELVSTCVGGRADFHPWPIDNTFFSTDK